MRISAVAANACTSTLNHKLDVLVEIYSDSRSLKCILILFSQRIDRYCMQVHLHGFHPNNAGEAQ